MAGERARRHPGPFAYHAATVTSLRRSGLPAPLAAALVAASLLVAGCSGGGGSGPTSGPTSPPAQTPTRIGTTPGLYEYRNAGLVAVLDFDEAGRTATLEVQNGTGRDLGEPFVYVLDARDGHQIDGRIPDAAPIPEGARATFTVRFPPELEVDQIGLAILVLGGDNYGAFVPR